jgi:hypothetical protein
MSGYWRGTLWTLLVAFCVVIIRCTGTFLTILYITMYGSKKILKINIFFLIMFYFSPIEPSQTQKKLNMQFLWLLNSKSWTSKGAHTRTSLASESGWARVPMSQTGPCVECHEPDFGRLHIYIYIRVWLLSQAPRGGLASQTHTCMGTLKHGDPRFVSRRSPTDYHNDHHHMSTDLLALLPHLHMYAQAYNCHNNSRISEKNISNVDTP